MIFGIGTDVVQIPRIERMLSLYKSQFTTRILSEIELTKMNSLSSSRHANFLSKRFAAKEAISKALGSGIGDGLNFKDIVISNDSYGKPLAEINTLNKFGAVNIHLSISDDYPICVAFAIVVQNYL